MLWLEMSRDLVHGGGDWAFGQCLWSPVQKPDGSRWPFWETVRSVKEGDSVLHLRGAGREAAFVGFSRAAGDGFISLDRPPVPGQWSGARRFYRVLLADYLSFPLPIRLDDVFRRQDVQLRNYFQRNKERSRLEKRRLFYVIQSGKLQCLNGAYLSEVDGELLNILLHMPYNETVQTRSSLVLTNEVDTGERLRELRVRIGQAKFAQQVRDIYGCSCCFPECLVKDRRFLVAGHIARWVDDAELRGQISNGICFCLMHDRAFELGLFTITLEFRIWIDKRKVTNETWAERELLRHDGKRIAVGKIGPSQKAIRAHWARHGIVPAVINSK